MKINKQIQCSDSLLEYIRTLPCRVLTFFVQNKVSVKGKD